ncbi:MAG TPA: MtrAB system histidine kinase MtrB [Trebonia sp.]|jgi:two-component system sensor histidine kinase MtrB
MDRSAVNPDAAGAVAASPPVAAAPARGAPSHDAQNPQATAAPSVATPPQAAQPEAAQPETPRPQTAPPETAPSETAPEQAAPEQAAPEQAEETAHQGHTQRDVREAWEMALRRNKLVRWVVAWLPHRLTILIRSVLRLEHLVIAKAKYRWRKSLQLRVVGTTLVISATMIAILGFFLTEQIAYGLTTNAENTARTQALDGLNTARSQPGLTQKPNAQDAWQFMNTVADELKPTNTGSPNYYVVLGLNNELASRAGYPLWVASSTVDDPNKTLTPALIQDVQQEQFAQELRGTAENLLYYATTTVTVTAGRPGEPAVVVGAPVGNWYQLYYVVPLDQEQQTLHLVQTTLIGVGIALVVLLAAIASLVTRWVVVPVRHAARAAQRLSAGELEERMPVGGADDLGALATSFNDMAASLQEKLRELEELSKAQRQFVSDVSHELRTPMTTIRMAAEILFESREQLDPAAARSAELLQGQTERFESLLTDLLEISKHDANVATLDAEPADVCDIVRRSADDAQRLAERRGCRIEFRLPAEACIAEVDRRRVERILRNLLVNAVEHGEGRDVVVTVSADSDAVAVAVRDHGVGLGPGEEQLVFERFWRADPARARTTGGTGLGLAISLEDARLHGGWLQAWGERGRGSVFRLTLPRVAGQPLAGSPLPLGPDEAEIVTSILEADLAGGAHG